MGDNYIFNNKRIVVNILISFIVFFLFAATLEIILRTTHMFRAKVSWTEPDDKLSYRLTPGKTYWYYRENDHPISGRINNYGFRDDDWTIDKPHDTYRIAVIGDSYVEALQVESDRTFLSLTERELNGSGDQFPNIEMMNFGQSGFTQVEELIILKDQVTKFSPDMVILFFLPGNDISDISQETASDLSRPFYSVSDNGELILNTDFAESRHFKIRSFVNWFKQRSALISLIAERYNILIQQRRNKINNPARKGVLQKKMPGYLSLGTVNPAPIYLKNYQLNKKLIKTMSDYCKEKGMEFMLVTINTPAYIPEVENEFKKIDPTFSANYFEDDLSNFAESLGAEALGLQSIFREHYRNNGLALHWAHWNYEGHEVVAGALSNKLRSALPLYLRDEQ